MAVTFLTGTKIAGLSGGTTPAIDTTGATLLVAMLAMNFAGESAPTDSLANTWVALTGVNGGSSSRARLYYVAGPTTGGSHTFTSTSTALGMVVAAFAGTLTSSVFEAEVGATAESTTVQPGSLTPSASGALVVSGLSYYCGGSAPSISVDSGYSIVDTVADTGVNYGSSLGYIIETTAVAQNPTWTVGTSGSLNALGAVFKAASGTAYTLTAEQGGYVLGGQTVGLVKQSVVTAEQGSYAVSGQSVGLLRDYVLDTQTGLYVVRFGGSNSMLPRSRRRGR